MPDLYTQKIHKLYEDIVAICIENRCDVWRNSWMWNSAKLKYYYLVYLESDGTLHYNDINDMSIEIEYDKFSKKYRIDLKTRYEVHHFWLFDKNWLNVELYVKELVKLQYNSIQESMLLVGLTSDFEVEPTKMYQKMVIKQRKDKLQKLKC